MTHQEFQQRFTITDRLGEGGFGEVFKAYDTVRDRWVALKVSKVKPELESVRLSKEVELINRLPEHPNIAFYEACYTFKEMLGEYDYGLLQYYEEGNLLQLLSRDVSDEKKTDIKDVACNVSTEQKTSILKQILNGLEFLHEQGIIHRDLKPQNILIVRRHNGEYVPKITDFGISKKFDAAHSSVFSNSLAGAGTLAYSSPEQLADRDIRKNADLWSFGVIAFRVLTGQLPFTTGDHASTSEAGRQELFHQINSGNLPNVIKQIPEPWQTLIRRCLITDPAHRIKNVREAKAILAGGDVACYVSTNTKTDDHTKIERPSIPAAPVSPRPQKSPENLPSKTSPILKYLLIAASCAVIVASAVFVWLQLNRRNDGSETVVVANSTKDLKAESEQFLAANKIKPGVITTESGLQYRVITEGTGKRPGPEDRVIIQYHGTLLDGVVFESTSGRNEPAKTGVNQVVKGLTEGLRMMPAGSKYLFWIPSNLAYGDQAVGQFIKPNSMLIYEVELLGIEEKERPVSSSSTGQSEPPKPSNEPARTTAQETPATQRTPQPATSNRFAPYTETAYNLNLQMIAVQGGSFTMGCTSEQGNDCFDWEKPSHRVTVSDFYIGKYEVTQAQWRAVMGTTVRQQRDKANTDWPLAGEGDNYPMYYVSWDEAQDFIRRLNAQTGKQYRLPTEAEWEFAARGGNSSRGYKYSGSNTAGNVAWYSENSNNATHPVGTKSSNELGIFDMSGNVWEWCNDWYGDYNSNAQTDPRGPSTGSNRVLRGGSWSNSAGYVRVTYRLSSTPGNRYDFLGLRLACSSK